MYPPITLLASDPLTFLGLALSTIPVVSSVFGIIRVEPTKGGSSTSGFILIRS